MKNRVVFSLIGQEITSTVKINTKLVDSLTLKLAEVYQLNTFSGTGNMGHTGSDPGTTTALFLHPKTKIGRFIMINTDINGREGFQQLMKLMQVLDWFEQEVSW